MIGEDAMNEALRKVLNQYGYKDPPHPTSYPLIDALADLARASARMLALDGEDVALHLKGELIGTDTDVGSCRSAPELRFLIALEDLVPSLAGDAELPTAPPSTRRPVAELQTQASRLSPNTPSTAFHTSSHKGEKV
jgi:hypothetical protein